MPSYPIQDFAANGIAYPLELFEGDNAEQLLPQYDDFQAQSLRVRGRESFIKPHLLARWVYDIATHPKILDAVEIALGPDLLLWSSDFFVKKAGKGTFVTWHQDTPFWHLDPLDTTVSVWLSVSPSTIESGCMRAVPGTHRDGDLTREWRLKSEGASDKDLLSREQLLSREFDDDAGVDVELQPGQFSMHHGLTVHGGRPNRAAHDRIGFVMRYITPNTRQLKGEDSAMQMRGDNKFGLYLPETPPAEDFSEASVAQFEAALKRPSGFNDMVVK